jgi:hypothetical protein
LGACFFALLVLHVKSILALVSEFLMNLGFFSHSLFRIAHARAEDIGGQTAFPTNLYLVDSFHHVN